MSTEGDCELPDPANTLTDRLNTRLNSSGPGYILRLCPSGQYLIQAPILFAAPNQEISTVGYPTDSTRATLIVNGPVFNGTGHTTAVDGTCSTCSGVKLRNIQIDGTRHGASPTQGGANIEMGGGNSDQLIEYVHSRDPRSWSCLHVAEGPFTCNNVTIQNNDIGPCGSDTFQEWADGVSMSCRNSIIRNNMIQGPTDGGIVLFGAPGTQVYNNTIWILNQTLLGGINMVDYDPWNGDYTNTVVTNNTIYGGFATSTEDPSASKGSNFADAVIKIAIAIGPQTWFGDRYGNNVSKNGVVIGNRFSGAFSYGIAVSSAANFTVQDNVMFGNTSFLAEPGVNCSSADIVPQAGPFLLDTNLTQNLNIQSGFQVIPDGKSLTCVFPPAGGDFWPFGLNPSNFTTTSSSGGLGSNVTTPGDGVTNNPDNKSGSAGRTAGIAVGIAVGILAAVAAAWFMRKWTIQRAEGQKYHTDTKAEYSDSD